MAWRISLDGNNLMHDHRCERLQHVCMVGAEETGIAGRRQTGIPALLLWNPVSLTYQRLASSVLPCFQTGFVRDSISVVWASRPLSVNLLSVFAMCLRRNVSIKSVCTGCFGQHIRKRMTSIDGHQHLIIMGLSGSEWGEWERSRWIGKGHIIQTIVTPIQRPANSYIEVMLKQWGTFLWFTFWFFE